MDREQQTKRVKEILEDMSENDIVNIWNEYARENCYDDEFFEMDMFDGIMENDSPSDLANKIFYGDFCPNNKYFGFNGYGNLTSGDYYDFISYDDLANYIIENEETFDNDELLEFFDNLQEEQEEE